MCQPARKVELDSTKNVVLVEKLKVAFSHQASPLLAELSSIPGDVVRAKKRLVM